MNRTTGLIAATLLAASAFSANGPPLASVWNIAASGKATSSGDLAFRITANDGSDPVDITVPVMSCAGEDSVARTIQRSLSSQLPRDRYNVKLGEGTNVLVSDPRGRPNFSLELVDSDIENVRVAVQSVTLAAPPTVPPQAMPAEPPAVAPASSMPPPGATPAPGTDTPPPRSSTPAPAGVPVPSPSVPVPNPAPVPSPSMPVPNPATPAPSPMMPAPNAAPPPNATGGAGAPASAPPPRS